MLKVIGVYLLIVFTTLNASNIERELGISVGLNSTKNDDGLKFENPTLAVSYQDNKYVVSPRVDLEYVNIKDDYASSLLKGSINGVYEYENSTKTVPYVLMGVGYEYVNDATKEVFESHPFVQAGAGLYLGLDKGYKARIEAKLLKVIGGTGEGNEAIITAGMSMPLNFHETKKSQPILKKTIVQQTVRPIVRPVFKTQTKIVYVDKNECPVKIATADLDRDGITDSIDQCPATPCNFTVDSYGCPVKTTLKVNFETNSATIRDTSIDKVNRFANFLMNNKGSQVNIVGHTDSVGTESNNMSLSYRRATSVVNALVHRGVSPSRLRAEGKGESMPIASNKTVFGKAMNRRIEAELSYPKGRK